MTGKDDGGFSPHPGDPWHPQWRSDDEGSDVDDAATPSGDAEPVEGSRGRRRRFGRRSRRDPAEAVADFEDLLGDAAADLDQEPLGSLPPILQDPFTDVLQAEGRAVRRQPPAGDEPPAWTVEAAAEAPDALDLPVESDVAPGLGQAIVEDFDPAPISEPAQSDLFSSEDGPEGDDPVAFDDPDPVAAGAPPAALEGDAVGAYGVAGPEAFDALAETTEEDLGDWERFMQGEGDAAPAGSAPDESVGDPVAFDAWVDEADEEPVAKRRWFSRRSGGGEDAGAEETLEPGAWDETVEYGALGTDAEEAWEAGFGPSAETTSPPVAESATPDVPGVEADGVVGGDEFAAAVDGAADAAAVQAAGSEEWSAAEFGEGEVEAAGGPAVQTPDLGMVEPVEMVDPGVEDPDLHPAGEAPSVGEEALESADWEGDPGRVPSSWFAEIDEDSEVPPPVADTPETEWPDDEGRWEGRTVWASSDEPAEVFDVEVAPAPLDETPSFSLDDGPMVPEGYQPWSEAVEDAVAGSEDTAEYQVHPMPIPDDGIPEGFERFPGTDSRPDGLESPRAPFPADEDDPVLDAAEFDERVYSAGGTVEHRGLAEAIAAAGDDEDLEWQAISAAMPGVSTGVVGFEDVADLAHDEEYIAPVRSNLAMRALTGIALIGLLGGSLVLGDWAFSLFVGLVVMLGLGEFYLTLSRRGFLPLTVFGLAGGLGILVATWFHGPVAIPAGVMLTTIVVFFFYAFAPTRHDALADGGLTILGVGWAVGGVAFAIPIAQAVDFQVLILVVVGATAAMDIGAFETGRRWGRRPLAPVLSPKKTLEGLLGGALLTLAVAAAIGYLEVGPFDLPSALALGAIVVVTAPLGDLGESMIKRGIGVKDMGSTLPGHGGVFDRIDALMFVVPAAWVLFETIGFLG